MRRPSLPSPALVVAIIALVVALGGTGYAALKLPRNSVGPAQIKRNAVTGSKVRDGSLRTRDFSAHDRAQLVGPTGPAGPAGPAGTAAAYAHVLGNGNLTGGQTRNVGAVSHPSPGTYCFTGLPDGLKNVVASIDVNDGAPSSATSGLPEVQATLGPGTFSNSQAICPNAQAAVFIVNDSGSAESRAFYILFN